MTRKTSHQPDDPEQSKRFIETTKQIGTDEAPEAFDKAFRKVVDARTSKKTAN